MMTISYNRLWKLLIDRRMKKVDLQRMIGVSSATITKLSKDKTVNTGVLIKICEALKCDTSDIMCIAESDEPEGLKVESKAGTNN